MDEKQISWPTLEPVERLRKKIYDDEGRLIKGYETLEKIILDHDENRRRRAILYKEMGREIPVGPRDGSYDDEAAKKHMEELKQLLYENSKKNGGNFDIDKANEIMKRTFPPADEK